MKVLSSLSQIANLARGSNFSALLLSAFLNNILAEFPQFRNVVKTTLYADNVIIHGSSRCQAQQALVILDPIFAELELIKNLTKTMAMKLRRGGQTAFLFPSP